MNALPDPWDAEVPAEYPGTGPDGLHLSEGLPGLSGPEHWDGRRAPDREFIVPGWIARGSAGLLGGEDGVGKSLLAQQLATCASAGVDFLGLPIERMRTIYLTCEDATDELHRRQEAINAALGLSMTDLKGWLRTYSLKGELRNDLATFDGSGTLSTTERYEQLREACLEFGAKLVFLDNAAHVFAGNENARHDVAAFLGLLERLSILIGGAVILLAHPNKQHGQGNKQGNEYSGSTGWSAHVRNRLFLDWDTHDGANPDGRVLRRSKANYAAKGEEIEFIWHKWAFTRLADLPASIGDAIAATTQASAENEAFMRCLAAATEAKRAVSHNPGSNYAPKVFAAMPEGSAFNQKSFTQAMERLIHIKRIVLDQPLWRGPNRVMKQGIKAAEKCTDPPARTPCTDLHETPGNAARFNPPILKYSGAARGAAAPLPDSPAETDAKPRVLFPPTDDDDPAVAHILHGDAR